MEGIVTARGSKGSLASNRALPCFLKVLYLAAACDSARVWPYFVKRGFLITPPLDAGGEQLTEALARLSHALSHVLASPTND